MRWGWFAAAVVIVLILQKTLLWALSWSSLDLFLALALFVGLNASGPQARIAAWLCGFAQDLAGEPQMLGIHSLVLGLTGFLLVWMRDSGAGQANWTRLIAAQFSAWAGQFVYLLLLGNWFAPGSITAWTLFSTSFWTALLASVLAIAVMSLPAISNRRNRVSRRW